MNRLWSTLMVLAIIVMMAFVAYDLYISATGGNATFSKYVSPITADLGTSRLEHFNSLGENLLVVDTDLDNR